MSSDKNAHLQAVAKLTKKHGISNVVAVCPIEHDLAYTEDNKSFVEKTAEAEAGALQSNAKMTLLKTNLTFGPSTHLLHFLTQCALVGKVPYKNLASHQLMFNYAPIHTDDLASAVSSALGSSTPGSFTLAGSEQLNLH